MEIAHPLQQTVVKLRLLDLVRGVLRRRHYSIRTEQSYVDWIRRFILFLYRDALELDSGWIEGFERPKRPARLPVVLTPMEARGDQPSVRDGAAI